MWFHFIDEKFEVQGLAHDEDHFDPGFLDSKFLTRPTVSSPLVMAGDRSAGTGQRL